MIKSRVLWLWREICYASEYWNARSFAMSFNALWTSVQKRRKLSSQFKDTCGLQYCNRILVLLMPLISTAFASGRPNFYSASAIVKSSCVGRDRVLHLEFSSPDICVVSWTFSPNLMHSSKNTIAGLETNFPFDFSFFAHDSAVRESPRNSTATLLIPSLISPTRPINLPTYSATF